jgi:hypothetical protein
MTATARRRPPYHRGQIDTTIYPGITGEPLRISMAVAPLDRLAIEMDAFWGTDRLPTLVSPATASRYGKAMDDLNRAIGTNDPEQVAAYAAACIRGLSFLDAEAKAAGHTQHNPTCWQLGPIGIVRDVADMAIAADARPGVTIYSMQEVGMALAAYGQTVVAVKDAFPGAVVSAIRRPTPLEAELEDEIPF